MTSTDALAPARPRGAIRALAGLCTALVVAGCFGLSAWQFSRHADVAAVNAARVAGASEQPVQLEMLDLAALADPSVAAWTRVEATGTFVDEETVWWRSRQRKDVPGVHAITPLQLDDGRTVLVDRGFVAGSPLDPPASPPPAPTGTVTLHGVLLEPPRRGSFGPVDTPSGQLDAVFWVDPARLDAQITGEVLPLVLQPTRPVPGEAADGPRLAELPGLDAGPHLGYALQWIAFALTAAVTYALWLRSTRSSGATAASTEATSAASP